jgi:hypothetical protein
LKVNIIYVVTRFRYQLTLVRRAVCRPMRLASAVEVLVIVADDSIDIGVLLDHITQDVVKRAILHH